MDRGAWRAAVHGVAESRPRLSSSSSSCCVKHCFIYSHSRVGLCECRAIIYPFRPDGYRAHFHFRAMTKSAAVNVLVRRFALTHVHSSAGHAHRAGETPATRSGDDTSPLPKVNAWRVPSSST